MLTRKEKVGRNERRKTKKKEDDTEILGRREGRKAVEKEIKRDD